LPEDFRPVGGLKVLEKEGSKLVRRGRKFVEKTRYEKRRS